MGSINNSVFHWWFGCHFPTGVYATSFFCSNWDKRPSAYSGLMYTTPEPIESEMSIVDPMSGSRESCFDDVWWSILVRRTKGNIDEVPLMATKWMVSDDWSFGFAYSIGSGGAIHAHSTQSQLPPVKQVHWLKIINKGSNPPRKKPEHVMPLFYVEESEDAGWKEWTFGIWENEFWKTLTAILQHSQIGKPFWIQKQHIKNYQDMLQQSSCQEGLNWGCVQPSRKDTTNESWVWSYLNLGYSEIQRRVTIIFRS